MRDIYRNCKHALFYSWLKNMIKNFHLSLRTIIIMKQKNKSECQTNIDRLILIPFSDKIQIVLPTVQLPFFWSSVSPMKYQAQASQWASRANMDMNRASTMPLYCEYLSIFWSRRAKRRRRVNFKVNKCRKTSCNKSYRVYFLSFL